MVWIFKQLLSLSLPPSAWRDTITTCLAELLLPGRGQYRRELPAPCPWSHGQAQVPSRYTVAPEVTSRLFPITDRRRSRRCGQVALLAHTPSPEPSPHPRFPQGQCPPWGHWLVQQPHNKVGALQGLFVHQDFPSARPGFPNPARPLAVKVRAYLSSAVHPAR